MNYVQCNATFPCLESDYDALHDALIWAVQPHSAVCRLQMPRAALPTSHTYLEHLAILFLQGNQIACDVMGNDRWQVAHHGQTCVVDPSKACGTERESAGSRTQHIVKVLQILWL